MRINQEIMPDDWDIKILGDIADVSSGGSAPQGDQYFNGENPFVRVQHVDQDSDSIIRYDLITDEAVKKYKLKKYKSGTIVFPKSGASIYLEKRAMLPVDAYIVSHLCAVNSGQEDVDQEFLFYSLKQIPLSKEKADGYPTLNLSEVKRVAIPAPSFEEQRKVVCVLSGIKKAIEQQEQIIAKTKELKRSLMQRLFTYGLRGEELKETEIGLMPESWTVVEVGELGEIITGTTPPTKNKEYYMGGGYQFISPFDLGNTKYAYKTEKEISSKGLSVSRCLPKDAVLVVCIGSTIGKVGMTSKDKSATNQQINTIVCDKKYNPHFVYYGLLFKSKYIRSLATPSPVPIMSKGKFQKAVISIPANRDEQDKIAEILSAIDEKVEKAQSRKHALQDLFRSMLQLLMTGQVRVKDIDFGEDCE